MALSWNWQAPYCAREPPQFASHKQHDHYEEISDMICRVKKGIKIFCVVLFTASLAVSFNGVPVRAARTDSATSVPQTNSDSSEVRLPDPQKDLRDLSKNLKLTRDQQEVIGNILQERTREMQLLLDVKSLSEEFRNTLAAIVMNNSNAQIESLLKSKQKIKFDNELIETQRSRQVLGS
jgi:hypothetical protein